MSLEISILRDLRAGQATIMALADNIRVAPQSLLYTLTRLVAEGRIEKAVVADGALTVYRLTTEERLAAR